MMREEIGADGNTNAEGVGERNQVGKAESRNQREIKLCPNPLS